MLKQLLIIGGSNRYRYLFTALKDLGLKVAQIPFDNNVPIPTSTKPCVAVLMEEDSPSSNRLQTLKEILKKWPNLPHAVSPCASERVSTN